VTILGIDTGGTFTDAVREDGTPLKVASSRDDPASVISECVERLAPRGDVDLRHGTTVATNAVLEGNLGRVGVIVNRGFRDLLFIGRQARPSLYALEPGRPELPTSRELCAEIPGRIGSGGEEIEPFDGEACARAGRRLVRRGAQAIAVVLLNAWARPHHEEAAAAALGSLGVPITTSSGLNPEFREVERGVCAVINAGLRPPVGLYLERLASLLSQRVRAAVMTSEGGLLSPDEVGREPARLLVSGPSGGLVAAQVWADALSAPRVLTLDMGGTSTDVAWLDGALPRVPELSIAGHVIRLPSLEIHTVGAGGGSLVRRDRGGAMTVGPQSAGADPGPAAYGKSDEITVTDANLLLGRIAPRFFVGGEERLDLDHAEQCARVFARGVSLSLRRTLEGVVSLADLAMARALRVISLERGRDPRGGALLVFGGAGGLHGAALARALGVRTVIVPPRPGVLSAQGLSWAPPARTLARSVLLDRVPGASARRRLVAPLVSQLREGFRREGFSARSITARVTLDLRYRGQSFELEVEEGGDPVGAFHHAHVRRFGFSDADRDVELVAVRASVAIRTPPPRLPRLRGGGRKPDPVEHLRPRMSPGKRVPVFDRDALRPGHVVTGPALVADGTASVWLDAKARARVHGTGALVIEVKP